MAAETASKAEESGSALEERWRELLSLHARTLCEIDRELQQHGLCASDFEVMDILAEESAEDGGPAYRIQELTSRVHLSQSALSRLIGRLEKDGLVCRGMCSEDRRGVVVELTEAGRERHALVLPIQRAVLARMLVGPAAP